MQKQFYTILIFVTLVFIVSVSTLQDASAQTKVHDLYDGSVSVAFSPDGKHIATGDTDGDVVLWEVGSDEYIYYRSLGGVVQGVAFSPDGRYIAADGANVGVRVILMEASSGVEVGRADLVDEAHGIHSLAYSPDGMHVAIGDDTGRAYLWNVSSGRWGSWTSLPDELYSVAFSPNGEYLATGDSDGYAGLWEVSTWWGDVDGLNVRWVDLGGNVKAVAFSPNGRYFAADGYDGRNTNVTIYDIINNKSVRQIDPDVFEVNALAFSPDGQYLAVGGTEPEITIYQIGTEEITSVTAITVAATIQTSDEVHDLAWSPDGNLISDGKAVYRTPAVSLPKIALESQTIDDSATVIGSWSRGNSNSVIESGERIELKVTLKNDGINTANNVRGILRTEDSSVQIHDSSVDYGNIRSGSSSSGTPPPLVIDFSASSFKIEVEDDAKVGDILFTLTVTADNGGPWYIPITLSVVDSSVIRLALPENLISEVASSTNSRYFVLNAKFPTLTGISEAEVSYGDCTITLHIPSNTQAFIFPIKTIEQEVKEEVKEEAIDLAVDVLISIGEESIPGLSLLITLIDAIDLFLEAYKKDLDLKVKLQSSLLNPGRPETEIKFIVLLKKKVESIGITIEQEYRLGDGRDINKAPPLIKFWDFDEEKWAAPAAQTLSLADYPPIQLLPSEIQQYLLLQFAEFGNIEALLKPNKTAIDQNYPNPFNPETWIPYQLAESADVSISIYAADGKLVRTLELGHQPVGIYEGKSRAAYWDGKNELGEFVASGVYFYTLTAGNFSATRKMLIRK